MEITINDLARETNYSPSHIVQLIKRGALPPGRKEGKSRYLPYAEAKLILGTHKPGEHWVKGRSRPGKRKAALDWSSLL